MREKPIDFHWHRRALDSIANGALTNSKRAECLVKGIYPTHLDRGLGCHVWDTRGVKFIDFICGLGTNILGYGQAEVAQAIAARAHMGASLSLGTRLEVECAEKVKEIFPFIDRLRFLKSGSDACSASIRIARAYTGRARVLSMDYHGWSDGFVSLTPPAVGVRDQFNYEKLDPTRLDLIDKSIAAVIIEPVGVEIGNARQEWLEQLRAQCTRTGTVLIFDEVITGFRFPKFSVAGYYGITPDLICLGKAIANGMPLAVVGGKKPIMECGEYFISSTYAGETLSLAAAMKTMTLLQTKFQIQTLWERGEQFMRRFNELWPGALQIRGYPTRGVFQGDDVIKALFWQEACRAGILFGPSWFFNFAHPDVTDGVLNTCSDIITRIKTGLVRLEGELPVKPFAQQARENESASGKDRALQKETDGDHGPAPAA